MKEQNRELAKELHRLDIRVGRSIHRNVCQSACAEGSEIVSRENGRIIRFLQDQAECGIPVYQKDLEKEFGITRSTASRVLLRMEDKGLIERESVPEDARLKRVVLTEQALRSVGRMKGLGHQIDRQLLTGFTEEEKERLFQYLDRLLINLDCAEATDDTRSSLAGTDTKEVTPS